MREIKFRAWRIESKSMYLSPDDIRHLGSWFDSHLPGGISDPNNVVIMQYTGLKDKRGVEIYEGDIISATNRKGDKLPDNYKVFWATNHAAFYIESIKNGETLSVSLSSHPFMFNLEVIGNIYENK